MKNYKIDRYRPGDLVEIIELFKTTVREVNKRDYTPEQIMAWAPDEVDQKFWARRLNRYTTLVARTDDGIVGFGVLSPTANIEMLYVHKDHQLEKTGTDILNELEKKAREMGMKKLTTQASITASSFFEKMGYKTVAKQKQLLRGVSLEGYSMAKNLEE